MMLTNQGQHSQHDSLENPSKKEKKYIENQSRTDDKNNASTGEEFLATVDTVVNETIGIENDVSTTNNKNKTPNTTNINPTESDESENSEKIYQKLRIGYK